MKVTLPYPTLCAVAELSHYYVLSHLLGVWCRQDGTKPLRVPDGELLISCTHAAYHLSKAISVLRRSSRLKLILPSLTRNDEAKERGVTLTNPC